MAILSNVIDLEEPLEHRRHVLDVFHSDEQVHRLRFALHAVRLITQTRDAWTRELTQILVHKALVTRVKREGGGGESWRERKIGDEGGRERGDEGERKKR